MILQKAFLILQNRQKTFRKCLNNGVADGTRTHDNRNHNPGLYQLSYGHHCQHERIEPKRPRPAGVPDRTRTCNPQLRRLVLYPVELRAPQPPPTRELLIGPGQTSCPASREQAPRADSPASGRASRKSVVGVERFELPTSWSQTRRATRLRYTPKAAEYSARSAKGQFRNRAPSGIKLACSTPEFLVSKGIFSRKLSSWQQS